MKKIDYFWPRTAVEVTGIAFAIHFIAGIVGTVKPGYEWVPLAHACAFAASVLWAIGCIVWNAWLRGKARSKT